MSKLANKVASSMYTNMPLTLLMGWMKSVAFFYLGLGRGMNATSSS